MHRGRLGGRSPLRENNGKLNMEDVKKRGQALIGIVLSRRARVTLACRRHPDSYRQVVLTRVHWWPRLFLFTTTFTTTLLVPEQRVMIA